MATGDTTAGARRRADLVAQLQHHALGAALADARHSGERGDVAVGQRLSQRRGVVDREGRQRDLGTDAGDAEQDVEQIPGIGIGEAVQRLGILAHDHRGDEP